jgi:FKBP-type peptidyl-prolyl cis-trans isomerase FkpA
MRTLTLFVAFGTAVMTSTTFAGAQELKTEDDKTLYALGYAMSRNLDQLNLSDAELKMVEAGLTDGVLKHEPKVDSNTYLPKVQELAKARQAATAAVEKKASQAFLDKAAAEKGAQKLESGVIYVELAPGKGDQPQATDKVKVHYTGKLIDGKVFDSSVERGQPATFPLNGVIKCWTEGVQKMKVGGKAKLICPSDLAYGDRGSPPNIKPGATLVFEVELLDIEK